MADRFNDTYRVQSARAEWHDYSGGRYFITICTHQWHSYLGRIDAEGMHLSPIGQYVDESLRSISSHYPYAAVPLYVVMPNHVHLLLDIIEYHEMAVASVIGGFKSAITRYANTHRLPFRWQSRFYDHIIHDMHESSMIEGYISNNVANWQYDKFNRK